MYSGHVSVAKQERELSIQLIEKQYNNAQFKL